MNTSTTNTQLRSMTVEEAAMAIPCATAVFRTFKIDLCHHAEMALDEAARISGADVSTLEEALAALATSEDTLGTHSDTDSLIDNILTRYHETHRRELPELIELSRKVEAVYDSHRRVPHRLTEKLRQIQGELELHMKKEELILFPAMQRRIEGDLGAPIAQMRHDHDEHLWWLDEMVNSITLPEDACGSWRTLYGGMAKLAADLKEHIHLENNTLFPRYERVVTL